MIIDLWFARDSNGQLWLSTATPGEPPFTPPRRASSVAFVYKRLKEKQIEVNMVGLCDPGLLGVDA